MNLGQLRTYCNFMVNKDQKGNPATPEDFIILAIVGQNKFFDDGYKEMLAMSNEKGTPISDLIISNTRLKRFLDKELIPYNVGTFPFPVTMKHEISAVCENGSRPITKRRKVDLVSHTQFDRDITNDLRDDFDEVVKGLVRPDLSSITLTSTWDYLHLSFLRKMIDPVFDYCYDAYANVYYMAPGTQIRLVGGHYNLYEGNVLQVSDVVHNTATVFPYQSVSVELDVDNEYHDEIAKSIIVDMTIKDRELNVSQIEIQRP